MIVILPGKKRDIFNKSQYNKLGVTHPLVADPYKKNNIERWTDQSKIWPPIIPEPYKLSKASLLANLQSEEMNRMRLLKTFDYEQIKTGDVINFHYLHSISQGKGNSYKGLVLKHKAPNCLNGRIDVLTELAGEKFLFKIMKFSPFVTQLSIHERGSGNFRRNITNHVVNSQRLNQSVSVPPKRVQKKKK